MMSNGLGAKLLHQGQEVEVVPTFGDPAIFDSDPASSAEGNGIVRRHSAESIPFMGCGNMASRDDLVAFRNSVFNGYMNVGKGIAEARVESLEAIDPLHLFTVGVDKAMANDIGIEEVIDAIDLTLVPNFLKPNVL